MSCVIFCCVCCVVVCGVVYVVLSHVAFDADMLCCVMSSCGNVVLRCIVLC